MSYLLGIDLELLYHAYDRCLYSPVGKTGCGRSLWGYGISWRFPVFCSDFGCIYPCRNLTEDQKKKKQVE